MPYIASARRKDIHGGDEIRTVGELNYAITCLVQKYLAVYGSHYHELNGVIGVLECCKQEIYRRVVVPYEEERKNANGDIF